jgi:large subunit ribosomal protein L4
MEAKIYNKKGAEAGSIDLPENIFGLNWNADLVHQVFTSLNSNARANTAKTKDRSEVSGTTKKPWQQKGTGRARHGSKRSPIWVKGGVAHGPTPERNYKKKINKKMNVKALFTLLSEKLRKGQILFVDDISPETMKTKKASEIMNALGNIAGFERLKGSKKVVAHVAMDEMKNEVKKSYNNIPYVEIAELRNLNVSDVLNHRYLLIVNPKESLKILSAKLTPSQQGE